MSRGIEHREPDERGDGSGQANRPDLRDSGPATTTERGQTPAPGDSMTPTEALAQVNAEHDWFAHDDHLEDARDIEASLAKRGFKIVPIASRCRQQCCATIEELEQAAEATDREREAVGQPGTRPGEGVSAAVDFPEGTVTRKVRMSDTLFQSLGAEKVDWGEPDEEGFYTPTLPSAAVAPAEASVRTTAEPSE